LGGENDVGFVVNVHGDAEIHDVGRVEVYGGHQHRHDHHHIISAGEVGHATFSITPDDSRASVPSGQSGAAGGRAWACPSKKDVRDLLMKRDQVSETIKASFALP
jgi:hypothetical protein